MRRPVMVWVGLLAASILPVLAALLSPLLAWRDPIYIVAGLAGVIGFVLLLWQPLLAANRVPFIPRLVARRLHRMSGALIVVAIAAHVAGLWITSPPDVIDALLFRSPTPFALWGVIAMWAAFASAALALLRTHLAPRRWRLGHATLAVVIVIGTILHAVLIEGTMESLSKWALSALVMVATARALAALRLGRRDPSKRATGSQPEP